jgi:hypothetical protein
MVSLRIFEDTAVPAMGHCQSLQLKESHDGLGKGDEKTESSLPRQRQPHRLLTIPSHSRATIANQPIFGAKKYFITRGDPRES